MTGTELHTAVQYGAPTTVIVLNNQCYGTQYHWQRDHFSVGQYQTQLQGFDIARFSGALRASDARVRNREELISILDKVDAAEGVYVIEVPIAPQVEAHTGFIFLLKKNSGAQ